MKPECPYLVTVTQKVEPNSYTKEWTEKTVTYGWALTPEAATRMARDAAKRGHHCAIFRMIRTVTPSASVTEENY